MLFFNVIQIYYKFVINKTCLAIELFEKINIEVRGKILNVIHVDYAIRIGFLISAHANCLTARRNDSIFGFDDNFTFNKSYRNVNN